MKKLLLAVSLITLISSSMAVADCYSDGVRTGVIQKLSKKGLVIKSWEGELVTDGLKLKNSKRAVSGNVWTFSTQDAAVAKQLDDYMLSGEPVALRYCEVFFNIATDTAYRITKVTPVKQ